MKIRHSLLNLINGIVQLEFEEVNPRPLMEFNLLSRLAVEDIADPLARLPFRNPLYADRLVPLDMPEIELHPDQTRVIEVHDATTDEWRRAVIEKFSVDGRSQLRWSDDQTLSPWADLSRMRYRWVSTRGGLDASPSVPSSSP